MCKISIVIPVYNSEGEIKDTVRPFLSCTEDIELVFVNDASTDNSLAIIERIKSDNPNKSICIYTQEKAGVSVARNKGIELAAGDYIYFCDSDDLVDDSLIEKVFKYIRYGCDMVVWEHNILRPSGMQHLDYKSISCDDNQVVYDKLDILKGLLTDDFRLCMGTFLFKKSVILENDISFTEDCRYGEDLEFMFKLILAVDKIACISEELFTYVRHDNSSMGTYNIRRFDAPKMVIRFLDNMKEQPYIYGSLSKYIETVYFIKQYTYSLDACIRHLKIKDYSAFWKENECLYPGLRTIAQRTIWRVKAEDIGIAKKHFYIEVFSFKIYSFCMMLKNSLKGLQS